jgi:osmotically-inducible protein OsmY
MKKQSLMTAATLSLGLLLLPLAGCSKPGEPPAIEAHHDASGDTRIHVNDDQVKHNLDRAGQELKQDAKNLGNAAEKGAKDLNARVGPAAREALSDAGLTAKVKGRLLAAPDVHAMNVNVDSRDGRVTLSGRVSSASEKADILKIAARTEGVKDVVDEIQIGPANS